jgi:hypothetical protein
MNFEESPNTDRPVTEDRKPGIVWPIFLSYRRNEASRKKEIVVWLKEQLEDKDLEDENGRVIKLDVFVDVDEPYSPQFQANLLPHLQHSHSLIVLADDDAARRKKAPEVDFLYEELDWWAEERPKTPPIIVQLDTASGSVLIWICALDPFLLGLGFQSCGVYQNS